MTSSHKNSQQRNINGNYLVLPHHMAIFSIQEQNEHQLVDKYEV